MAKLTINEKDYYTEDFNAEQEAIYGEIVIAKTEQDRFDYMKQVLELRANQLALLIAEAASTKDKESKKEATNGKKNNS
tara:strand:+ start:2401 stop:2637 length:237 start_codon:yes stop_codon:yes gene_type:complete